MSCKPDRPSYQSKPACCSHRRRFLQAAIGISSGLFLPPVFARTPAAIKASAERELSLINLHTGEQLTTTYWAEGRYQLSELQAINHLLRDHRTGEACEMDNKLLDLLYTLHNKMDSKQAFQIISGYRSPQTNARLHKKSNGVAKKSLHMDGKAIDIRLPGCSLSDLQKAALSCRSGGVGYYPKSNFIHVDTGSIRHWG